MYFDYKSLKKFENIEALSKNFVATLSISDTETLKNADENLMQIVNRFKTSNCTRIEFLENIFYGNIFIPSLLNSEQLRIIFLLKKDRLFLVSDPNYVNQQLENLIKLRSKNLTDPVSILYYFIEQLFDDDLEKLNVIQDHLSELENNIYSNPDKDFSKRLTAFRRKSLQLSHYYSQFTEFCSIISENTAGCFNKKQTQMFSELSNRTMLLKNEADQLWNYTLEVRELYQEQLDLKQNEIMKILTIVTTVFLPLSLIAGWYGMNFKYMPELTMKYGYFFVIGFSIAIVLILCIWFKKKDFY